MVRVALISDIHDNQNNLKHAINLINKEKIGLTLFLGDLCSPFTLGEFEKLSSQLKGVFGNNDGDRKAINNRLKPFNTGFEDTLEITIGGIKIFAYHGTDKILLTQKINSGNYDIVATGHTHKANIEKVNTTLVLNPGEICGYLNGKPSFMVLDVDTLEAEIKYF